MISQSAQLPRVLAVTPDSPADTAGVIAGDLLLSVNGEVPRDVIQYRMLVDEPEVSLEIDRGGMSRQIDIEKGDGELLGIEVQSSLFDQVRTCDNHCTFCFIYQLPPGMRKSLYLKDDDFRLSFLYGNFTTLTRFTEADLERVITEGLSPLYVSIHSTEGDVRTSLLRNKRGATSLRWLRALLDHGVDVHGQVVVCPGINDAEQLERTLAGVLDDYSELASLAIVPLGISDHSNEPTMRSHTVDEAITVIELVEQWQKIYLELLGHRLVFAADEYYLLAGRPFPDAETYEGFAMHEDGIGMARTFEMEFRGQTDEATGTKSGFFAWVEGAPAEGYRAPRLAASKTDESGAAIVQLLPRATAPIALLTSHYGAKILEPLLAELDRPDLRIVEVENRFFGGNIGVAGLMVGEDVARVLAEQPAGHRYLLPDVCLSGSMFLDGTSLDDLPRPVEVVPTDGIALRRALGLDTTEARSA